MYDLYLPEKSNSKSILYVPGLPGHPRKRNLGEFFAENGFTFFEMRFIGTWESDGIFTMENCLKSLDEAYSFVKGGNGIELRRDVKKEWSAGSIVFMGSSFGGGVVLSTHIKDPLTFILLAPVADIKKIKESVVMLPSGNDDMYNLISKGYANVYRGLTKKDWMDFMNGESAINPDKNLGNLKNKRLVFVQGKKDTTVNHADTDEFVKKLRASGVNAEFVSVENAGHGSDLEDQSAEAIAKLI
ncbi:MAG: prolyl oligopeptidase family serine peptidase [Patescibacteria group bacterium]|nr:prolyl oligopeptidase family serine peptidase [Patescibacteria group bacterium]MDE1941071.1 prolyl oligopeptidase family serine peptidase [Patescibacteria group bacterium]MDE1967017.1 prolyl oligopeptidase family serine peptidase [Patescibacteria group bacterium]